MKKYKNIITCLLVVIIVTYGALTVLFATGTISFNSNYNVDNKIINSDDIYESFLNTKEYLNNFSENEHGIMGTEVSYTYYDLDNNGVEELILNISDGYEFSTKLFYTYENDKIIFIDKFYHFGTLSYNKFESSIVYTEVRPSLIYGHSFGFYKLEDNKFNLSKSVGVNIQDGVETYFVNDNTVSKNEYEKYFDNNISFNFKKISD